MKTVSSALKMRDLPCYLTEEDIIQFFQGYGLIEGSVKMRKWKNNNSSGEACVLFQCNSDATIALKDLKKKCIGGRPIKLFHITAEDYTNFDLEKPKQSKRSVSRKNKKD